MMSATTRSRGVGVLSAAGMLLVLAPGVALAQEGTAPRADLLDLWPWLVAFVGAVTGLVFAFYFYKTMMASPEGDARMIEIAGYVREGANAYLRQQYRVVAMFFVVIFVLLFVMAFVLHAQSKWVPFAFLTGGFFSGLSGYLGMKTATWASSRTTEGAKTSLNSALRVAFRSGAVMGLTVVGLGLIDICLWFLVLYVIVPMVAEPLSLEEITVTMLCFGMGASSQALFARVGGGIFTKAADVGADLVGKVEAGIPEDDPRNPAVVADNVGDNVGDVAGMGADLYESYCGAVLASAALGVAALGAGPDQLKALVLPMAIAGVGILLSVLGIFAVRTREEATQRNLLNALALGVNTSAVGIFILSALLVWLLLPDHMGIFGSIAAGLVAGWVIGKWTEYSTSDEFAPTKRIASQSVTGPATVIIAGISEGMWSVWLPVVVVGVGTMLAYGFANNFHFDQVALGLYGIGVAAVGMLSTLGITLATDAYGPIADNAGGNAEMTHQQPIVRQRTDALDSLGNTTAATGKGFAIGSAALTALALLAAYVEEVRIGIRREGWAAARTALVSRAPLKAVPYFLDNDLHSPVQPAGGQVLSEQNLYEIVPGRKYVQVALKQEAGQTVLDPDKTRTFLAVPGALYAKKPMRLAGDNPGSIVGLIPAIEAELGHFMTFYNVTLMNPQVLVGLFIGAMLTFIFCALTMKAVGRAASQMVEEVRRQFRTIAGLMEGKARPDYATCVQISTRAAQRQMILPSLLALIVPLIVGLLLGVPGVMGLLAGGLTTGFVLAVMMANAGGAWDNAKKHIERGAYGGKGSPAHKAGVVGDTVGDPFKDTSGPSLNILIKLMSMVSIVFAGMVVRYALG